MNFHFFSSLLQCDFSYLKFPRFHQQRPRQIQANQLIHESVIDYMKMSKYSPKATFSDEMGCDWTRPESLRKEEDPYPTIGHILQKLTGYSVEKRLDKRYTDILHPFLSTGQFILFMSIVASKI